MAKLVDALALGASGGNTLGVQVPLLAPVFAFATTEYVANRLTLADKPCLTTLFCYY